MKNTKGKMLIGAGLLGLGLLGAVFAQGMFGQSGNGAQGQGYAQGMMGGGMMGGGMGMMSVQTATSRPISELEARRRATDFAVRFGKDSKIRDFMIFTQNFYVQIVNAKTGAGLGELLVDRYTGIVQPEHGPNMMWNTRFGMSGGMGMMGGNMMGNQQNQSGMMGNQQNQSGMMGNQSSSATTQAQQGQGMMNPSQNAQTVSAPLRFEQVAAQKQAETFLAGYLPNGKILEGLAFPGYYTFDYGRKEIEGMLSVNAYTGEIWVHGWHGLFLGEGK